MAGGRRSPPPAATGPAVTDRGRTPPANEFVESIAQGSRGDVERLLSQPACTVVRAGWFPCPPAWQLRNRVLPNWVLWICVAGGADLLIGGEPHRLDVGHVLLLPPHVRLQGDHDPKNPLHVYSVHFVARLFGVLDAPTAYGIPLLTTLPAGPMAEAVASARRIIGELHVSDVGHALAANADCARVIALLWRQVAAERGGHGVRPSLPGEVTRLAAALQLIESRYAEPLSLRDLADTVHLDPSYFSALFKRVTGVPPSRYIAQRRLDRARELLLATELPVREIAGLTGFRDPLYLSRVFQRAAGLSPTGFRRAHRNPSHP